MIYFKIVKNIFVILWCLIHSTIGFMDFEEIKASRLLYKWKTELYDAKTNGQLKEIRKEIVKYNHKGFKNKDLKRNMKMMADVGDSALADSELDKLKDIKSQMKVHFVSANVHIKSGESNELLKRNWLDWHNNVGMKNKTDFMDYVELKNKAANLNGYKSGAEYWIGKYEDPSFEEQVDMILKKIMPLYRQLHGYVRHKLNKKYGSKIVDVRKPFPMHLLGSLWAGDWSRITNLILPYPKKPNLNVSYEMRKQKYTAKKMLDMGNEFFQSMNMTKLPERFWDLSVIEKPTDDNFDCHPRAYGSRHEADKFYIRMCTQINMDDFFTIHHELGHIQYYLQYNHQPIHFKDGANPGFHEAVGDVISLSVSTPKHLQKIGLLDKNFQFDYENQINHLMQMALRKVAKLPFTYIVDKFRYGVFRGEINAENTNTEYWNLYAKYGGVEPPEKRDNRHFDATAMYHVSADIEYMRYFVANVIQFQFYKAACIKADEYEPGNPEKTFNNCDIYGSFEAGKSLKKMLRLGSSKPWPDAMEVMTGQRKIDPSAILEYFKPLEDWLINKNKELGVNIGWESNDSESMEIPNHKLESFSCHTDCIFHKLNCAALNNEISKINSKLHKLCKVCATICSVKKTSSSRLFKSKRNLIINHAVEEKNVMSEIVDLSSGSSNFRTDYKNMLIICICFLITKFL